MIDAVPDEFVAGHENCRRHCWVRIPGKHRTRDAAWDAIDELMATRH
jgi:hypothetical protein